VQEDEFRVAIFAGWPHSHLSAGKSSVQHPLATSGAVLLNGASARQEG
jgi:hypothetical protein